jgi:hypothetical protein
MDFILIGILLVVVGLAVFYVVRAKKKGVKCIGCPDGASCNGRCPGCVRGGDQTE